MPLDLEAPDTTPEESKPLSELEVILATDPGEPRYRGAVGHRPHSAYTTLILGDWIQRIEPPVGPLRQVLGVWDPRAYWSTSGEAAAKTRQMQLELNEYRDQALTLILTQPDSDDTRTLAFALVVAHAQVLAWKQMIIELRGDAPLLEFCDGMVKQVYPRKSSHAGPPPVNDPTKSTYSYAQRSKKHKSTDT